MAVQPLTIEQHNENRCFLAALAQTGNAREAAQSLGRPVTTFTARRSKHAGFAQDWDAALAAAHARFKLGGGARLAEANAPRTRGGEPCIIRRNGRLQLRRAYKGQMTRAAEQAFLRALSATANVRLSAAAAGVSKTTIYKRRDQNEAFRREMRHALEVGFDRLELSVLRASDPDIDPYDEWLDGDEPAPPRATVTEMLQLLHLHRNTVKLGWEEPHRRRRRNESKPHYSMRLFLMWKAEQRNLPKERAIARADAYETTGSWRLKGDWPEVAPLPPLDQVTGWSAKKKPEDRKVGSSRVDLQACKLEYSIVSPK